MALTVTSVIVNSVETSTSLAAAMIVEMISLAVVRLTSWPASNLESMMAVLIAFSTSMSWEAVMM